MSECPHGCPWCVRRYFDTVEEMEEYTQFADYGAEKPAISAGIVFNSVSAQAIDYTLRFNQTEIEDTTPPYVDRYGLSPIYLMQNSFYHYIRSGFLGWQNAIDQTMLQVLNHEVAVNLKMGVHVFPFPVCVHCTTCTYALYVHHCNTCDALPLCLAVFVVHSLMKRTISGLRSRACCRC